MSSTRGAASTVLAAVVSRAWGSRAPRAASPWWSARARRYASVSSRVGRAMTKLHDPTEMRPVVCPGYEPAGTIIGLRKACLARMRRMPAASGTMKRAPAGGGGGGAAEARGGLVGHLALHQGQVEPARLEEGHVLRAALGILRAHHEGRISLRDRIRQGLAVDGKAAAGGRGAQSHGVHGDSLVQLETVRAGAAEPRSV